jgi:hypothetical protein
MIIIDKQGADMRAVWGWTVLAAMCLANGARAATVEGNVDPKQLLDWVAAQKKIPANLAVAANGKDKNNGGTGFCKQCSDENSNPTAAKKTVSLWQTSDALFFEADMDIDCDGSNEGVCAGTDPSHQNQLSCDGSGKCSKDNGGPISAATHPFYVLPTGSPFSSSSRGIGVGTVAAIINTKTNPISIVYAPMLDEDGVSQEIGEASAKMASMLGVPNNPETGGQDTGLVYIVFRGSQGKLTSISDWADHQKAITLGQGLAAKLVATLPTGVNATDGSAPAYAVSGRNITVSGAGHHMLELFDVDGARIMRAGRIRRENLPARRPEARAIPVSHRRRGRQPIRKVRALIPFSGLGRIRRLRLRLPLLGRRRRFNGHSRRFQNRL